MNALRARSVRSFVLPYFLFALGGISIIIILRGLDGLNLQRAQTLHRVMSGRLAKLLAYFERGDFVTQLRTSFD